MTQPSEPHDRTKGGLLRDASWTARRGPVLLQIGLATFGILALELAVIRWISGQVRILAYFNNLILIGCFLGMGVGLLVGRRLSGLQHLTLPALALLAVPIAFSEPLRIVHMPFPDGSIHLWGAEARSQSLLVFLGATSVVLALFCAVVAVFVCAGAAVGHLMRVRSDLRSYSADLAGSLLGVLAMSATTAVGTPPSVWLLLGGLPFLWLSRRPLAWIGLLGAVVLGQISVRGASYSAYNRIDVVASPGAVTLFVNRDFHQYMFDLSGERLAPPLDGVKQMYDLPFLLGDRRERALVIGAGTGNDVQAALRQGFRTVDSVDIDGEIIALGRRLHPERPYSHSGVNAFVDDGRAYFERYHGSAYDVVAFGFVDSHAMFSSLSMLRLDNYLYTEQALRAAWRLVGPDGQLSVNLSFMAGPWMQERLYWTLADATGTRPIVVSHAQYAGAAMLVAARAPEKLHWERCPFPWRTLERRPPGLLKTSDDWPFLYLRPHVAPWGYLTILGSVLLLALVLAALASGPRTLVREFDLPLFLMGAGFLLLETRGVTALSLLFGSTWIVNAVVFGGVLLMALCVNLAVERLRPSSPWPGFALLLLALAVLYFVDVSALNRLPLLPRGLAGGVLIGLPVGFAGMVVSQLLSRAPSLGGALGANLLGAVLGGSIEYLSIYSGLRALTLVAAGFYLLALLVELRRPRPAPALSA
jgi:hypothetical protein